LEDIFSPKSLIILFKKNIESLLKIPLRNQVFTQLRLSMRKISVS
jgi:hypothetical protein